MLRSHSYRRSLNLDRTARLSGQGMFGKAVEAIDTQTNETFVQCCSRIFDATIYTIKSTATAGVWTPESWGQISYRDKYTTGGCANPLG